MNLTYFETEDAIVTISDEGLRRLKHDNDLLRATARTHEVIAGVALGAIVVAIVLGVIHVLTGGA